MRNLFAATVAALSSLATPTPSAPMTTGNAPTRGRGHGGGPTINKGRKATRRRLLAQYGRRQTGRQWVRLRKALRRAARAGNA